MEFNVVVGETGSVLSESGSGVPTPSTQAAQDVKAEYARIMSDPTHPTYEDFKHGGKKSDEYVNDLYRKLVGNATVPISNEGLTAQTGLQDEPPTALSPEDAKAWVEIKEDWGEQFETHLA